MVFFGVFKGKGKQRKEGEVELDTLKFTVVEQEKMATEKSFHFSAQKVRKEHNKFRNDKSGQAAPATFDLIILIIKIVLSKYICPKYAWSHYKIKGLKALMYHLKNNHC